MTTKRETPPARRPGRPRTGESPLTRDRILQAALGIVDEEGLDALSMRRLASELGVDPMSLYHHLPSKAELVSGLVELVFSGMGAPSDAGAWDDRVRAWAAAYRRLALSHPQLVLQIVSDAAAVSAAMLLISEPLYQALVDARLPPASVAQSAGSIVDFVNGFALAEASRDQETGDEPTILQRIHAGPSDDLPTLRRVYEALADEEQLSFDSSFAAGIEILIAGITVTAGKHQQLGSGPAR